MSTIMSEHINEHRSESPNAETRALFSCKICFEPYSKCFRCPVSLNCGHTFCLVCIRKLGMNRSTIQCGICRKNTYSNYRRLGKNIVLTELLEWMNILANDSGREPTPEEKENLDEQHGSEWPEAQHFIGPSNLEEFYEELQTFDALVHNWPSYGSFQRQLDNRVQNLRCGMSAIEAQLRNAGDTYRELIVKMEELRTDLNNQMAAYQLEQQEGPDSMPFRNIDWENTDDDGGWNRGGGLASPPPVVLPLPISDDSDRESTSQRLQLRSNLAWNYNNRRYNNPRNQRPRYQVLVLSEQPISCHPLPPPQPEDDWGSSSGWSDSENDKTSNETTGQDLGQEYVTTQPNGFDEPPTSNHTETIQNRDVQQSSNAQHFNNIKKTPRIHRQSNYQRNKNYANNQKQNNLNQSNGSRQYVYYGQTRKVTISQKF